MKFIPCSVESDRLLYKAKQNQDESIHKYERLLIDIFSFTENKSKTVIQLFSLSNPTVQVGSGFLGNQVVYS